MAKRSRASKFSGFVLRSGYVVPFDPLDTRGMLDHLKHAILGESLQRVPLDGNVSWDAVATEIVAEIRHLADNLPADIARAFLVSFLCDATFERLRATAVEQKLDLPPETIH